MLINIILVLLQLIILATILEAILNEHSKSKIRILFLLCFIIGLVMVGVSASWV